MTKKEREALIAQLQSYLPELKAEIDSAKVDLKNARSLKTQLEGIISSATELVTKLNDTATSLDTRSEIGKTIVETISTYSQTAEAKVSTIDANLRTATARLTELEVAYNSFVATKERVDDPTVGLLATLDAARETRRIAQGLATRATNLLANADRALSQLQTRITTMDSAYAEFEASKKKIDDPTDGLDAILTDTQELRDEISAAAEKAKTLFAQVSGYKDEAASNVDAIKNDKTTAGDTLKKIQDHEAKSNETRQSILKILKITSEKANGNFFKRRSKFVAYVAGFWFIVGVAALFFAVHIGQDLVKEIFGNKNQVQLTVVIARAFVVTPLLVFAFYAFRNYGKERILAEQYAFKEISGSTIEGYVELAHRSLQGAPKLEESLVDVVVGVVRDLHTEPLELQKSQKMAVRAKSKLFDVTGEIQDTLHDIGKNVKDIAQGQES